MPAPEDPGDPLGALRAAVRALPDNPALRRELAAALAAGGAHDEALAELERALALAPQDGPSLVAAARSLFEIGRYDEALQRYEAAVAADLRLADAALKERILKAGVDPRARLRLVAGGPEPAPSSSSGGGEALPDAGAPVSFADVGGLDDLKEKIRLRVIYPLKRPELYAAYGKRVGGGLLFYGPPGCGKTHLARATAGEAGLHFIGVGIDEVLDMWLGQSEKRLAELFRSARAKAPCVLFFDEVDALGGRRSNLRHESYRTLVTQFLSELDGAGQKDLEGVLVLGATNAPWDVDPAFRRPGRFGDVLFVPPPDLRARVEILKLKLRGKPQKDIDVVAVARATELFSGADLTHVVDGACETALQGALKSGTVTPLTTADLQAAAQRLRPSTREWFAAARNFVTYSNDSGQYDEVAEFLRRHNLG
jgi:AAA+ superfamily predicted ATPase